MRSRFRFLSALMVAGVLVSPVVVTGCMHRGYDHAAWNDNEGPYYARWEQETHRDHREWAQRNADDQQQYWAWRHDHDHDHDHQ